MKPIPTAEEFFEQNIQRGVNNTHSNYLNTAIKFAKLHVEAALKAASEKAQLKYFTDAWGDPATMIDRKTILNAYSLEKIK